MVELIVYTEDIVCKDVPTGGVLYTECNNEDGKAPEFRKTGTTSLTFGDRTVISLNKDIFDMADVTKQSGDFSYDFRLPADDTNKTFFGNFGNLNWQSGKSYSSYRATLQRDGFDIYSGRLVMISYDQQNAEYQVRLFGNLGYLKYRLDNVVVRDIAYLKRFVHRYDGRSTIVDSWNNTLKRGVVPVGIGECRDANGDPVPCTDTTQLIFDNEVVYPLADHQGMGYYHNENVQDDGTNKYVPFHTPIEGDKAKSEAIRTPFDASRLSPAVKLVPVIKAILEEGGFKVDLANYVGLTWDNLYVQLPPISTDYLSNEDKIAFKSRLNNSYYKEGWAGATVHHYHTMAPEYGGLFTVGNAFVAPLDGSYTFNLAYDFQRAGASGVGKCRMTITNDTTKVDIVTSPTLSSNGHLTGTSTAVITLSKGDRVYMTSHLFDVTSNGWGITAFDHSYIWLSDSPVVPFDLVRNVGDYFGDLSAIDLLKEFLKLSNGVIDYDDKSDENAITVKPLMDRWLDNESIQLDITDKIDRSKGFKVSPAIELMSKEIEFKFKEGNSVLDLAYIAAVGVGYGSTKKINTGMQYAGSSATIESTLFAPFTTGAVRLKEARGGSNDSELVIPLRFKDTTKFDKSDNGFQLFLWDGSLRTTQDAFAMTDFTDTLTAGVGVQTAYPLCHNMLLSGPSYTYSPDTPDSNWDYAAPFSIEPLDPAVPALPIGDNWFDNYYKGYIDALYDESTVIVKTGLLLTPKEFSELSLWSPVLLAGGTYRILSYRDYDAVGGTPMGVTLMRDNIRVQANQYSGVPASVSGVSFDASQDTSTGIKILWDYNESYPVTFLVSYKDKDGALRRSGQVTDKYLTLANTVLTCSGFVIEDIHIEVTNTTSSIVNKGLDSTYSTSVSVSSVEPPTNVVPSGGCSPQGIPILSLSWTHSTDACVDGYMLTDNAGHTNYKIPYAESFGFATQPGAAGTYSYKLQASVAGDSGYIFSSGVSGDYVFDLSACSPTNPAPQSSSVAVYDDMNNTINIEFTEYASAVMYRVRGEYFDPTPEPIIIETVDTFAVIHGIYADPGTTKNYYIGISHLDVGGVESGIEYLRVEVKNSIF